MQQKSPLHISQKRNVSLREKLLAQVKLRESIDARAMLNSASEAALIAVTESFVLKRFEPNTSNRV